MKRLKQKQKDELETVIKTSKKTSEILRAQTILMLDEGDNHVKVKRMTGFSKTHAFHLRRAYLKQGIESLSNYLKSFPASTLLNKTLVKARTIICRLALSVRSQFFQSIRHFSNQHISRSYTESMRQSVGIYNNVSFDARDFFSCIIVFFPGSMSILYTLSINNTHDR
jgi:hypothetical protein